MKTTKFMFWLTPLLVLSLVCSFTPTAMAQNYYPAEIGNTWVLLSTDGAERRTYSFEGPETVDGEELILFNLIKETVGTDVVAFDKSWISVGEDGEILLHQVAFDRGAFGIAEATFDTPVTNFPAALPLGYTWEIVTETVLQLVGAATTTSTLEVVAIEDVETPLGVFKDCVKVETNRRAVTALTVIRENEFLWLAPDVGPVKFQDTNEIVFDLESYNLVEAPAVEDAPAEEPPIAEETPAVEETPATEEVPPAEEVPVVEETLSTEETPEEPAPEEPMPEPIVEGPGFDLTLEPGLNMISIPLMPAAPYTAKSLAEMLDATAVIQLDATAQRFIGYTVADEGDGFDVTGDKGYIVNTPAGGMVKFTGEAWDNQPEQPEPEEAPVEEPAPEEVAEEEAAADDAAEEPAAEEEALAEEVAEEPAAEEEAVADDAADAGGDDAAADDADDDAADAGGDDPAADDAAPAAPAAPALATYNSAWAFIVTSDIHGMETGTAYTLVAENLRTGIVATENLTSTAKRFSAVWADLNRKSVVEAGDKLEVALYDDSNRIVSGPFQRTVTTSDIRNAFLSLQLNVGDIQPQDTLLAQNFPNPFNPETWIPYQLSAATEVKIDIYDISGHLVRSLDLGWQPTGSYMTPSSAAYWDGKNAVGERVASGIYFYTLQTSDFAATPTDGYPEVGDTAMQLTQTPWSPHRGVFFAYLTILVV